MPDPFAPKPCQDCGTVLPYKVLAAYDCLYGGYRMDPGSLADKVAWGLRHRADTDRSREGINARYPSLTPLKPITEREIAEDAVRFWVFDEFEPDDLTAAVAHYGDLGDPDGSECERIETLTKGTSEEWARSLCNLEAHGPETPHSFEQVAV